MHVIVCASEYYCDPFSRISRSGFVALHHDFHSAEFPHKEAKKNTMEYVSLEGLRNDGRRPNECRHTSCAFENPISANSCSGSAEFTFGQTTAVAAVFGPHSSLSTSTIDSLSLERLKVTVEITSAAFGMDVIPKKRATNAATLMKSSKSSRKNKELAVKFEQILRCCVDAKRYPRSEVYVSAATINDDGSASAALFNSIVLALVDAGIPMLDVFVAVCATRLDGETLLDQNEVEERGRGVECFVVAETKERRKTDGLQKGNIGFNSKMNDEYGDDDVKRIVSYDISGGKLAPAAVDDLLRACTKGCDEVSRVVRKAMKKRLRKLASTTRNLA